MNEVEAYFPPKLAPLFDKQRYTILYGGRGAAKSWSIARALLIMGVNEQHRILCTREFMSSISDSVHRLLADQIELLGLQSFYEIGKATISGANGTEIRFSGIRSNPQQLKSFEGITICWCEEAANVSNNSWDILIPTIRRQGSRIIISFNPELATDPTYQRFVLDPPPNSAVIKLNWDDNPFFPDVLKQEMEYLKEKDPDSYNNVWLGYPRNVLSGAIYANELRAAEADGRITKVPYDPLQKVHTFWDLGYSDNCSIFFAQSVAMEFRFIDYIESNQKPINDYLKMLQDKPYIYGTDYLPHDARAKSLGTGRSIEEIMRSNGRNVQIVPKLSLEDGINAARTIFPNVWIDADRCADGLQCLRRYRYEPNTRTPVHDSASHGADAFRYAAVALKAPRTTQKVTIKPKFLSSGTGGWLGR